MLNRRVIALLAAVAGIAFMLAGSMSTAQAGDSGASGSSTLQKVLKSHVLTVGMVLSIPPQESESTSGKPEGMDVDIAQLLATSLDATLKIVDVPEATRIAEIQTGKVDVLFSSPAITLARAQVVAFTQPYIAAGTVLVTLKNSGVNSAADMAGKKVGLLAGAFYDPIAARYLPHSATQHFQSTTDETIALKNHQIAAYFRDSNTAAYAESQDSSIKSVTGDFGPLEYDGFAVQQGDQIWLNYLNTFIFTIEADGSLKQIFIKWFGSPPVYSPILTDLSNG